ncbi:MAG: HTH-type transcriptional activator Btr [Planctomycetes bacterium ADurb.Bin401]|nr:MAG: HTH-type transcriptional activator Btr [Planctomycetes bacterium ADurb.Bin401]
MDFSNFNEYKIFSETRFRTPLRIERQIGLWVDRIGEAEREFQLPSALRKLGQYAIVFIEQGDGYFIHPAYGQVRITNGNAILLFPDEPTAYYPSQKWYEKYIVWNGPESVKLTELGYLNKSSVVIDDDIGIFADSHAKLKKIITNEDKAAIFERKNIVTNLILEIFKLSKPKEKYQQWEGKIKAVISWLSSNYSSDISVSTLAQKYNFSESNFRRYFKQYTGRSPREFINSLRISKAKSLLKEGMSIKEVASVIGFDDIFYFMRLFKKATGISCGNFRKE